MCPASVFSFIIPRPLQLCVRVVKLVQGGRHSSAATEFRGDSRAGTDAGRNRSSIRAAPPFAQGWWTGKPAFARDASLCCLQVHGDEEVG